MTPFCEGAVEKDLAVVPLCVDVKVAGTGAMAKLAKNQINPVCVKAKQKFPVKSLYFL